MKDKKGISVAEVEKINAEVTNYANNIKAIFSKMDDLMENLKPSFYGDVGFAMQNKFKSISTEFTVVYNNILSYSKDLDKLLSKYDAKDSDISISIKNSEIL